LSLIQHERHLISLKQIEGRASPGGGISIGIHQVTPGESGTMGMRLPAARYHLPGFILMETLVHVTWRQPRIPEPLISAARPAKKFRHSPCNASLHRGSRRARIVVWPCPSWRSGVAGLLRGHRITRTTPKQPADERNPRADAGRVSARGHTSGSVVRGLICLCCLRHQSTILSVLVS